MGVALLMIPVWIIMGVKLSSLWTWYLAIPTLLWIAGFMLVDRRRQKRRQPALGETLRGTIEILAGRSRGAGLEVLSAYPAIALFFVLVGWFIYWLNQFAVRKQLEPRRKELQTLLNSLNQSGEN